MINTPVIHVNTWITTRLPDHGGWKAELAKLAHQRSGHLLTVLSGKGGRNFPKAQCRLYLCW